MRNRHICLLKDRKLAINLESTCIAAKIDHADIYIIIIYFLFLNYLQLKLEEKKDNLDESATAQSHH